MLRDAQLEAIKTYLYLKIKCGNKPLAELFSTGQFSTLQPDRLEITESTRKFLETHPEALALYEYASSIDDYGKTTAPQVVQLIRLHPETIDYDATWKQLFYGETYTDYLFSLPMGAGKTFLMAAFIYLDIYFAQQEPDNPLFAHNFLILAPSGLKSSIVPSLKTIQQFDPSWILPEPAASNVKRCLMFDILDAAKSEKKSNQIRNPNVQKIAIHQPLDRLFGFIAITNAEKVILDRLLEKHGQISLLETSEDERDRQANELRNLLGKIPSLSVFIDEVHHAQTDDTKLREVVHSWANKGTINNVIGFSGTPYLPSPEKISIAKELEIASPIIANTVFYYPLSEGIGNFLKRPEVHTLVGVSSLDIVEKGVRGFLDRFKNHLYEPSKLRPKLAIYCGSGINYLEEIVFPFVSKIVEEFGLNPGESILKYHGGNKKYPFSKENQARFETLDSPLSPISIILLVQIGKEGWNCKSLSGVVLSQTGDCPTNMVLQTSCRCLRQIERQEDETALIYLNADNAESLNRQLQKQQHISLEEFQKAAGSCNTLLHRYDRTKRLHLPPVDFYQMKVSYDTIQQSQEKSLTLEFAESVKDAKLTDKKLEYKGDFEELKAKIDQISPVLPEEPTTFPIWVDTLAKEGFLNPISLRSYDNLLQDVYDRITIKHDDARFYDPSYDQKKVRENIRKAFLPKRSFSTKQETILETASLLKIENFSDTITTTLSRQYYPDKEAVEKIHQLDEGKKLDNATLQALALLKLSRDPKYRELANQVQNPYPWKDRTFHYMPYKTDSAFEKTFLDEVLKEEILKEKGLEVYYNGDDTLTNFHVNCYKKKAHGWVYIGRYTPDFLIIQRENGTIQNLIIVETKGNLYADEPVFKEKKQYMEQEFIPENNKAFGYKRFDYLYLEDNLSDEERISTTIETIKQFFKENQ